jgi:hypothetical protein
MSERTKDGRQTRESARRASAAWYARNAEYVRGRDMAARRDDPSGELYRRTRKRARSAGIPFDLQPEDVQVPDVCPVLGVPLVVGDRRFGASPSVDRLIPEKGYVRGNVIVCSQRANRIKNDATLEELRRVLAFYETKL